MVPFCPFEFYGIITKLEKSLWHLLGYQPWEWMEAITQEDNVPFSTLRSIFKCGKRPFRRETPRKILLCFASFLQSPGHYFRCPSSISFRTFTDPGISRRIDCSVLWIAAMSVSSLEPGGGPRQATGFPRRLIKKDRPFSVSRNKADKWVFAWKTFTSVAGWDFMNDLLWNFFDSRIFSGMGNFHE